MEALDAVLELLGPAPDPDEVRGYDHRLIRLGLPLVSALERLFRVEVRGLEHLPAGRALIVGNHDAGITFLAPFFFGRAWYDRWGDVEQIHFLTHDVIFRLPVLGALVQKLGAVRASHETAGEAFARGHKVAVWPGGDHEAFRPWSERARVDFGGRTGFLKLALRHGVPIVPLLSVGGHETFVVLARGRRLARLLGTRAWLRTDVFPIYLGLPWGVGLGPLFHLPVPAKVRIEVGEPIPLDGYTPADADDPVKRQQLYNVVQGRLQQMMDRAMAERRRPVLG